MTSKLTFSELTESKSLEIKMTTIMSFYEDIAMSLAYKLNSNSFDIIAVEEQLQTEQMSVRPNSADVLPNENVLNFIKPLQRSSNIVDYLIQREQLQSNQASINC